MNDAGARKTKATLAELDKSVCARRGVPRPARAAARARAQGASLGEEVLAQIDLLKGKHSRKRGLFALVRPAALAARPVLSTARAYDIGAPIRVSGAYSGALAASLGADTGAWVSAAGADDGNGSNLAFAVELFEEEAATGPSRGTETSAPPVPRAHRLLPSAEPVEVPVATALSRGVEEDGVLGLDLAAATTRADDADQFEREIEAILSGKTRRPAQQSAVSGSSEQVLAPSSSPPSPTPASRPHDIFEQMGRNMSYATAFNLPPMELGRRFDDIEREIALEEGAEARRPVPALSLELTDDEISASLGLPPRVFTAPRAERAAQPACVDPVPSQIQADMPVAQPATPATALPGPGRPGPASGLEPPSPTAPDVAAAGPLIQRTDNGRPVP